MMSSGSNQVHPGQGWRLTLIKVELPGKARHPSTHIGIVRTRTTPNHAGALRPINIRIAGAGAMRAAMMCKCVAVRQHYRLRRHTAMPNGNHNDCGYLTIKAT